MKLSELLRETADNHLSPICDDLFRRDGSRLIRTHDYFSCCAISVCLDRHPELDFWGSRKAALDFLVELGCPTSSGESFDEFRKGGQRQGARFLWLDFAALVAEDEGL